MTIAVVATAVFETVVEDTRRNGRGVGAAEDRVGVEVAGREFTVFVAAAGFDDGIAVKKALVIGVFLGY